MKHISKDLADKMVMEVLVSICKKCDMSTDFAKDSMNIMQNDRDNSLITSVLLCKARPSLLDKKEIDMKLNIITSLQRVLMDYKDMPEDFDFNSDLEKSFSVTDVDNCSNSTKLDFALNQFVTAFYEYERLEKKYADLMKIM